MGLVISILLFFISTILGYLITFIPSQSVRKIAVFLTSFSLGAAIVIINLNAPKLIFSFGLIVLFIIFNLLRAVNLRYESRTGKRLFMSGLALTGLNIFIGAYNLFLGFQFQQLAVLAHLLIFFFGISALYGNFKHLRIPGKPKVLTDNELPTVSVLIPARNEDEELRGCIESVLINDYPKLEVIVLDDCSQDKSSEIIKSFAQKGVRFIQGDMPKENWLSKNQAYETLAENASGDWYLFMGADVRLGKDTIRQLMNQVLEDKILMASVLPSFRSSGLKGLLYPLRAYWEVTLPRIIMRYPPVMSTLWIIHDEALKSSGGIDAVSQSVLPERYFAKVLESKNKYLFYKNSADMLVETNKSYKDQQETSVRLLYPQLRKSLIRLLAMTLLTAVVAFEAYYVMSAILNKSYTELMIALIIIAPGILSHILTTTHQGIEYKLIRTLLFPLLLVQELILAVTSAFKYEFSEVLWKGRNVCYPTLKAIPKLPNIDLPR